MTSEFPRMLWTSVAIGWLQTQSSVTLNFYNEKSSHDVACRQNSLANYCFNYFADKETRVETLPKPTSGRGAQKHGGTLIAVKINEITSVTDNELISN